MPKRQRRQEIRIRLVSGVFDPGQIPGQLREQSRSGPGAKSSAEAVQSGRVAFAERQSSRARALSLRPAAQVLESDREERRQAGRDRARQAAL